ncbi:hypothetical protein [Kineococcus sp. NPDC059986]|jgi:hypothetical protein|uniref:SbtR family transcriptional regulator n=1 Tax=Kineococcus sp. NPDC059986 TaxID=3155538 RepID=UPI00344CFEAE
MGVSWKVRGSRAPCPGGARADARRNREHLIATAAAALLGTHAPADALLAWMGRFAQWAAERQGITAALVAMFATGRFGTGPVCDEVQQVLETLLAAGAVVGELRAEVDPVDVGGLLSSALSVAEAPEQSEQLARMLTVVVDGLRPR